MCQVADRFFAAVRTLTSDEPVKERLKTAYAEQLAGLPTEDIPEAIRQRFELLRQALESQPATEKESSVQISVRKMSQADATRYVRSILAMFAELVRVKANGDRLSTGEPGGSRAAGAGAPRPRSIGRSNLPSFLARS